MSQISQVKAHSVVLLLFKLYNIQQMVDALLVDLEMAFRMLSPVGKSKFYKEMMKFFSSTVTVMFQSFHFNFN